MRRNYSGLDLIRSVKLHQETGLIGIELISEYDKKYPELSPAEQLINIRSLARSEDDSLDYNDYVIASTTRDSDKLLFFVKEEFKEPIELKNMVTHLSYDISSAKKFKKRRFAMAFIIERNQSKNWIIKGVNKT